MPNDFPVEKDAYVAFDGLSIRDKLRQRLQQTGIFTDQNFEGSNLSAFNDALSMLVSLILYNVNKSSANGQFSISKLYEIMNGIVKELDYKPIGHQTASLSFNLTSQNHPVGSYVIPRFTSVAVGGIPYTLTSDVFFTKRSSSTNELLFDIDAGNLLYQGKVIEYPPYTASGIVNETITIVPNRDTLVDNFNIFAFVKEPNGKWEEWTRVTSSYLYNSTDKVFEVRFNEKKKYEVKFGNDINGMQLPTGSIVALYYIQSLGKNGEVGANVINGKPLSPFSTNQYNAIVADLSLNDNYSNQLNLLVASNPLPSSYYSEPETVEEIRQNAPANFRSQFSLTTQKSYATFIKTNFSNIIQDVQVMNNQEYLDSYIKYYYDLGLTKPQLESRALFNQIQFADSCNFNNVYCVVVPKTIPSVVSYVVPEQKKLILNTIQNEKTLTSEVVISDPVYMAFDFAMSDIGSAKVSDTAKTKLVIEKSSNSRRNDSSLINDVATAIVQFFDRNNSKLGQTINVNQLNANILAIDGVKNIYTQRTDTGTRLDGVRMINWNPYYTDYVSDVEGSVTLEKFQYPFLNNQRSILSRIETA